MMSPSTPSAGTTPPTQMARAMGQPQQPSIGRIVVYHHFGGSDGQYPQQDSPAVVQKVNENGTCNLFVMSVGGGIISTRDTAYGEGPTQWSWPPRV